MKFFIAFALLIVAVAARPNQQDALAQVVSQSAEINPDGSWSNSLQTNNGIAQSEHGQLKQVPGAETPSISVQGEYTFQAPDGQQVRVTYVADENGFQPQGDHLPKNP